ncbi:MAG: hypothetical protein IJN70_04635 [Clostridia bacterium]|nr:hypothetical protein [Clostridia bacterium]
MDTVFLKILNMSISSCWIVLVVILLRFVLKKAPKWINCVLWGIAGLRLILPFSLESIFSLIPSPQTLPQEVLGYEGTQLQQPAVLDVISNPIFSESISVDLGQTVDRVQLRMTTMTAVWLLGIAVLLIYTLISYLRLKRKVGTAVKLRDNIYQSENVVSPFVLGLIKPKIYLPFNINKQDMEHVIAHEQAHISRKDHLWKPLGFLILTLHWFNPLVWVGYILLCRDIELACDEKVVKELNNEQRADYSEALLTCSVNRKMIAACPLAFGEVGVKNRVKSVLNYKKPAFWIIIVAIIASIVVAACFLTDPLKKNEIQNGFYKLSDEMYFNGSLSFAPNLENNRIEIKTTGGMHIYHFTGEVLSTGALYEEVKPDKENLSTLLRGMPQWSQNENLKQLLKNNKEAWYHKALDEIGGYPYILLSQKDGTLYMVFADFSNGEPTSLRYVYKLEYMGSSENISEADSISVEKLKEKYPQFFNVSTDGGLTVYVWQQAEDDYRCYLTNTFTEAISDNSFAYETGATIPEMRTILTTYDISKENISIHPVRNPLSSYYYTIDDEYREKIKNLFWAHIIEVEPTTEEESTVLSESFPPKGSFENPYNVGDSASFRHSDIHQKDVVYDYNASITRILTGTEAEERLKNLSSNYEEEKEALESFDLYLARVHIKYNEESTVKDRLPADLGVTAVRFDKQLQFIDPRFYIPDNVFKAADGEFYFWAPVLAAKNVSTRWLSITVGTYQGAPGIISGVYFNIPPEEKPVENTVEFSGSTYIRRCGEELNEDLGIGTMHLPEFPDSIKLKDYGIVFCDEEWDERTIIDVAIQGWARAYHMESDGELEGNHKILKFKMTVPEQMIETLKKRPGQYEGILAGLERNYYYLIPIGEVYYAYFHLEGDDETFADSIVKNAEVLIALP